MQFRARDGEDGWPSETSQEALALPRGSQQSAMHSRTAATSRCPRSRAVRPGLPNMATSESATGVAATMKADKANRESLAKKKSAVKADLERVTAELEEVEQMKADAEDLEDEELLAEMLSEEQRLQALKHQYTAELASIQEASQAAAQALRQRLRRITGDRALGASGKSTSSESSQPATPEVEANTSRLNALDQVLPGDSDQQRMFRGQSETDAASSKRGISGVGDNQPGSASKRARGESAVSKLINTFDSPRSEPLSPSLGSRGSGTAAARTYFTSPHDQQGGFTLGTSPSQGRAPTSSAFSATTSFRGPHSESLGAYTSQETPARPDSDLASFEPGNAYSAQESAISPVAQDNQAGFGDDAFAQFSPFGHKAKQQTSPFGQQAEVLPGTQAGFDGQEVPLKASDQRAPSGQPASGGLPVTEDAPQGIKEQVTPTSVTGTFADRSPFQSTWPTELTAQSLESQQSLGGSSFQGLAGKPSSPRRRPPPPPTVGSSFGRSSSGLPLSPTQANQGALQRLPSDAFGEFPNPSQSRPPIADPHSQPGATPRQQAQTDVFMESPQLASTEVRSVSHPPATSGATSQMPTGTVPVPPPVGPPTGQGEGTDSLFVGKTAFDSAVKSAPEPTAEQGIARESAFSKANTAGTGPHFGSSSPKVSTAPRSQPLASWTSFEDPGPLPPMPAPTPDDDPSDQDFCAPLPSAIAAQPSTTTAGVTSHTAKAAATPSAEPAPAPAQQVSKQRSNDPWATPVEPPAEVKAAENELLSATLAGLGGDAWGGNSFGPEMGKPLKEAGVSQDPAAAAVKAPPEPAAAKSQAESLTTQPSWMHLANSSNPFSSFIPMDNSASEPNPWATTAPQAAPEQQTFPPQPMGQAMGSSAHQQQAQQPAAFATWDSFDTAAPGQAGRQPQAAPPVNIYGGNGEAHGGRQPVSPDRTNYIEEIPVQELGLDPSLTIIAKPKEGMAPSQSQYDY
ncbi:hypothetical protein WJX79_001500, partial [Trebouxia sp. C0005]